MNDEIDLGIGSLEKIKTANLAVLEDDDTFEDVPSKPSDLAVALGYDGMLEVGSIEDRIRFYQRKTVEAALETGKCLILLKSITDYGEFEERVQALGFSTRSARRFMQAAGRVCKSANLALLAKQVKNVSAFLELLTLEDDDIQNILELDDLDRMSASQLRHLARKQREERDTLNLRLNTAEARSERLMRGYAAADPDLPKETVIARAYCMGAQKTAELKLGGLLRNFAQEADAPTEDARQRLEQQWVAANVIAARALDVLARMRELAPFDLPERVMGQHILSQGEAERWLLDSRMLENTESIDESMLHEEAPPRRSRGRPRKEGQKA